jgi:hypothetical protein
LQNTLSQNMFAPLSFYTILDPSKILESEELDAFVGSRSKNPFLLGGFISQSMESNYAEGWKPLFLVIKSKGKIVGTAPLMIREKMGIRFAQLFPNTYATDFNADSYYLDAVIESIFHYLFESLNCQFVRFLLSAESPNLKIIERQCKVHGISCSSGNQYTHYNIPVESTWDEFQKKKGRRRIIRQIECKLDAIGPWDVEYVDDVSQHSEVLGELLEIERKSWKAQEPEVIAKTTEELLMAWAGSENVPRTKTDFKCSVWFLKINDERVAYTFVIRYKGTAFVHKTSYDERYKKFYVGKYINNVAIRDMFNEGLIKSIDFMSSFPFMSFWTPLSSYVVEVKMWKGNLAVLWKFLRLSTIVSKFMKARAKSPIKGKILLKSLSGVLE